MSDVRYYPGVTNRSRRASDGSPLGIQGTRDGAIYTMDWLTSMMWEGRCFVAQAGSETTPLTAVAYNQDQPEVTIAVADATAIYIYKAEVILESYAGTDNEIIMWITDNAIAAGTSTVITDLDVLKSGSGIASSAITARQLHTANVTLTNYREVHRGLQAVANVVPGAFTFPHVSQPGVLLPGPATFGIQVAGTSTQPTFFAQVHFVILPETDVS